MREPEFFLPLPSQDLSLSHSFHRVRESNLMESLLTIKQLSEAIQVRRSTLYEWTHTGFIPHYKFPKGVRFKTSEIEEWLKKRKKKGRLTFKISCD